MINHVQPNRSANVDEHVLFSVFTYRWDDGVIFKNCARDYDRNKVHTYVLCLGTEELHSALWSAYLTMYLFRLKCLHVLNHTDHQGSLSKHDNMMVD